MYELILDRGTILIWRLMFLIIVVIPFLVSLGLLYVAVIKKKSRLLALVASPVLVGSMLAGFYTTLSPYAFYRHKIEPSVTIGEEVFKRYENYKEEHGHYPPSVNEIYFAQLDDFDAVIGVRTDPIKCDGFGIGCRAMKVVTGRDVAPAVSASGEGALDDEGLTVHIYDELIECSITNLRSNWKCRDHR